MLGKARRLAHQARQKGMTLLEVMLVLAIATLVLLMGIRQYIFWQNEVNLQRVRYNVNAIFQAMHYFYQANCYGSYAMPNNPADDVNQDQSGYEINYGQLNPKQPGFTPVIQLSIQQLAQAGFLRVPYPFTYNNTALIKNAGKDGGYYAAFIVSNAGNQQLAIATGNQQQTVAVGQVKVVVAQVAIKLAVTNKQQRLTYLQVMQGTCLSKSPTTLCTSGESGSGSYLVWSQPPSFLMANTQSDYWVSNPQALQFMQPYTTYPVNYLTDTATQGNQSPQTYQYYLCNN